jgi:GNAT superfamily N-acetyltransferase
MRITDVPRSEVEPLLPLVQADLMGIDPDVGTWLAAYDDRGEMLGVARVTEPGGARTIDDIWVLPHHRRRGVATALIDHAGRPLWLICDEDMIAFYERRGFRLADAGGFPAALANLYAQRGEWPRASDHAHFAMVRD